MYDTCIYVTTNLENTRAYFNRWRENWNDYHVVRDGPSPPNFAKMLRGYRFRTCGVMWYIMHVINDAGVWEGNSGTS